MVIFVKSRVFALALGSCEKGRKIVTNALPISRFIMLHYIGGDISIVSSWMRFLASTTSCSEFPRGNMMLLLYKSGLVVKNKSKVLQLCAVTLGK